MPQSVFRFEEFELDSDCCQLRRLGKPQKLERIPMELLILLVENRGKVVSREAIVDRLWGKDVFLETEHSINTAINKIRRALRDDPGNPRFVQTVFGKGYRFLAQTTILPRVDSAPLAIGREQHPTAQPAPVGSAEEVDTGTTPQVSTAASLELDAHESAASGSDNIGNLSVFESQVIEGQPKIERPTRTDPPEVPLSSAEKQRNWVRALIAFLVVGALGYLTLLLVNRGRGFGTSAAAREIHSIAVLPLDNLSNDSSQEYLADGMTDQLTTDLARASPLRVISRTSTMQYKGVHKSLPDIAAALNVDAAIEGSVLRSGGRVRITAQLLDARRDLHLWAQSYERDANDLIAMQDEVAQDIVHEIAATLQPAARSSRRQNVSAEAYDNYLHGRYYWDRRTLADLQRSISYYQRAIELAPNFAPAYAALGDAYAVISYRGGPPPSESYPRAREAADKALQLDDSLADAHALLGEVKVNYDYDWSGGEREFQRAIELNPNYPTAHHWYAIHLALMARSQEGQTEIDKAATLDPLSLVISETRGEIRYWARDPDAAVGILVHAQELDPTFVDTYLSLGKAYEQKRQFHEAEQIFSRAITLSGENPKTLMLHAHALALSGQRNAAAATLHRVLSSRHAYLANSDVATVYCAMEQPGLAMTWLEKAYANREEGMNQLAVEPLFDGCRHDPRFQTFLQRLNLPQ